jgi:hypothetical protein
MDPKLAALLSGFDRRELAEREVISSLTLQEYMRRRDEFLLPNGDEAGMRVNILAKPAKAT